MTDFEKLKQLIRDRGVTITYIAEKAGISRETFYNRCNGIGEFTVSEITGIANALRLTNKERDAIFFAKNVN